MNQRVGVVLVCLIALFPGSVAAYLLDVSASWQEPFEGTSDSDSASVSSGSAQAFVIAQQGGNSIGFSGLGIADADASGAHTQTQASISAVSTSNNAEIVSASTQWSTTISNISLDSQSWLFSVTAK